MYLQKKGLGPFCQFLSLMVAIPARLRGSCFGFACTLSCLTMAIGCTRFQLFCSSFILFISTFSHNNFLQVFSVLQPACNTYLGIISTRQGKSNDFFGKIEYELTFPIYTLKQHNFLVPGINLSGHY